MTSAQNPQLIAFYLPQYHPIPENDQWWGPGFTEWRNVVRTRPRFRGHYQPHLPGELGFYDLRLAETRDYQARLAQQYGISAFCYYHYWFTGRRVLQRPFEEVLRSGKPEFPFCLCWANENWTRAWDGGAHQILLQQRYSPEDDRAHFRVLAEAFQDPRYLRYQGKPVFLVYRSNRLPSTLATTEIWREEARKLGIGDLYLCRVESFPDERDDPRPKGFDAAVEFQPDWAKLTYHVLPGFPWLLSRSLSVAQMVMNGTRVYDYGSVVRRMLNKPDPDYPRYSCVSPSWDNSARRAAKALILADSSPELYENWLAQVVKKARQRSQGLVFINAWNEWAEGCHLEPDHRYGRAYLEATNRACR